MPYTPAVTPFTCKSSLTAKRFSWFIGGVALYTFLVHFVGLGARELHMDEGFYHYYVYRFFTFLTSGQPADGLYRYNPSSHGPLLHFLMLPVYWILGPGRSSIRLLPAIFGIALVFSPLLFRRWYSNFAVGTAMTILAVSTPLTWASHLYGPNTLYAFCCVLSVFTLFRLLERPTLFAAISFAATLALVFAGKEDRFIFGGILLSFAAWRRFGVKAWRLWLAAATVFAVIYTLLYTTFFFNLPGLVQSLFQGILLFYQHHRSSYVPGDFTFYVRLLYIYEWVPLSILLLSGLHWAAQRWRSRFWFVPVLVISLLLLASTSLPFYPLPHAVARLGLRYVEDLWAAVLMAALGGALTLFALRRGNERSAFLLFWATGSWLAYSYVNEKLAWLSMHSLCPLALAIMALMDLSAFSIRPLVEHSRALAISLVVMVILQASVNARVNLNQFDSDAEPAVEYTMTRSGGVRMLVDDIERYAITQGNGPALKIQVIDPNGVLGWIIYGYLLHKYQIVWQSEHDTFDPDVVVALAEQADEVAQKFPEMSQSQVYFMQEWARIDFHHMDLRHWLRFVVTRQRFGDPPDGWSAVMFTK
jgi:uncharacterized protein (TIGR03663 family)